jgi:hypothetical protein
MASANTAMEPKPSGPQAPTDRSNRMTVIVLLIVWAVSIGYMGAYLKRGWVPHDEGTLALSAERVLNGQLPHRDFDDYTGGLTYVHALAFRMLGISSASMRIVLFLFFVAWVPAVFYVASRFGSTIPAGAVTLLAAAWSVPNYPGPMPSWYNLFFATAGVAALLRYIDKGTKRWLFLAGLCAGLSFLAKIAAVYFIAAALLFFVFREQSVSDENNRGLPVRGRVYSGTVALGLAIFLFLLFRMIHKIPGVAGLFYFVLPVFGLVALLLARESTGIAGCNRERFKTLMNMCLPFGLGIAIPLIIFVLPYVYSGSVDELFHGLAAVPARAIRFATFAPMHPAAVLTIIPFILPIVLAYESGAAGRAIWGSILALFGCTVLILSTRSGLAYSLGWLSLQVSIPVLVLSGAAILLVARGRQRLNLVCHQRIMLLMCAAALCSLVQFPFAAPVYFLYVCPLVILAAMALFTSVPNPPTLALGTLSVFYLLFVIFSVTPYHLGLQYDQHPQIEELTIPRAGGLRVESSDAHVYEDLISLVQLHAIGRFIYAAPDCPEVYFLSGLQSPSRHYFEYAEDQADHVGWVLQQLNSLNVNVVAIKKTPRFSGPMSADLQRALELRFPHSKEVGFFEVRWKE